MSKIRKLSISSALSMVLSASSTNAADTYALNTGEAGAKRLDMQSEFIHKESTEHLVRAGLARGQVVVDMGCGTGFMTQYMASIVGPEGHVFAVDVSSDQLELARKRIHEGNYGNVTFIPADIESNNILPIQDVDLIYSRFFLMHLRNPSTAIQKMKELLKAGGIIALQEPINSTCHISGDDKPLKLVNVLLSLGKHLGVDYDIGLCLKALTAVQGIDNVTQEEYQYELEPDFARTFLTLTREEWGRRALERNVISNVEYHEIGDEIQKLNNILYFPKQIYITGQKR